MDLPFWLAALWVLIGMPLLVFAVWFALGAYRAYRERETERRKIDRRLAQVRDIPRVTHADSLRALAEFGDRREAELRSRFDRESA